MWEKISKEFNAALPGNGLRNTSSLLKKYKNFRGALNEKLGDLATSSQLTNEVTADDEDVSSGLTAEEESTLMHFISPKSFLNGDHTDEM